VPPDPSELPRLLGDVVICPEVAWRNSMGEGAESPAAPGQGGDQRSSEGAADPDAAYHDELALLVVHGILHLQGMDHEDEEEAAAMRQREQELLERHHRPGPSAETEPGAKGPAGAEEPASPAGPEGP
jgi:probable rRNA maturation factor